MIGIIVLVVATLIIAGGIVISCTIHDQGSGAGIGGVALGFVVVLLGFLMPWGFIAGKEHFPDPNTYPEIEKIESVEVHKDIYVFNRKDGTQLIVSEDDVILQGVSGNPGIQQITVYHSWGNFWPGDDWDGRDLVLYTPSNKG